MTNNMRQATSKTSQNMSDAYSADEIPATVGACISAPVTGSQEANDGA